MLIRQLRFLYEDIKQIKYKFFINIVQLTVGLTLFCYIFQINNSFQQVKNMINAKVADTEVYMFRDESTDKKIDSILNEEEKLKQLKILYQRIQQLTDSSEDLDIYIAESDTEFCFSSKFKKSKMKSDSVPLLSITKNFIELYGLSGTFDVDELKEKFVEEENSPTPIIMGYNYKDSYKINDMIKDYQGKSYLVVGFLDKNSYYIAPDQTKELIRLDDFFLMPYSIDENDSMDYWSYIDNVYFMTKNVSLIQKVVEWSEQLDLFQLSIIDFSYQLHIIIEDVHDSIFVNGIIFTITLFFCFVGIVGNLLQFIANNKKEFAINLLCGASCTEITVRILLQIIIQVLISLVIVGMLFGITKAFVATVLFAIVFMLIVIVYPITILRIQSIHTILRRSYE